MNEPRKKFGPASLMALCLAVSAPAALAQATDAVTFYGIVDAGVEYIDRVAQAGREESLLRLNPSNQLASRWGLRGSEDLGGGLKAVFNLENGFSPDTGVMLQNGRLFGRTAVVGLEGNWGGVLIGRQRNTIFDLSLIYDPLAYATYGIGATDNAFFTQRADNSIKYTYKTGGLSTSWLYSFGRDALAGTPAGSQSEVPGNSKIGRQLGANVNYVDGPISVAVGFDQQHGTSAALASDTDRRLFIATIYNVGKTRLYAGMMRRDNHIPVVNTKNDTYWVGVRQPITDRLGIVTALMHTKLRDTPNKATLLGTSLYYDFSKRTQLYLNVGYSNNSGASVQGVTSNTPTLPGGSQKGIVSGILHRF